MSDPAAAAPKANRAAINRTDRILSARPLEDQLCDGSVGALNVCECGLDHQLSTRSFDGVFRGFGKRGTL